MLAPISIPNQSTKRLYSRLIYSWFTSPRTPQVNRFVGNLGPGGIGKDLNVPDGGFRMEQEYVDELLAALRLDVQFLQSKDIMDYSFLVFRVDDIIHEEHSCKIGYGNGKTYYGGIIDILQKYTLCKRAERNLKVCGIEEANLLLFSFVTVFY